jgi:Lrp/AsnC family transcriptional regulator
MGKIDHIDLHILTVLQADNAISQRDLADKVGLSQNACWRRLQALKTAGIIQGSQTQIDLAALGYDLTVFVMIRTRHHSREWADDFRAHVERLPGVTEFHRIGGDWDYLIKVVAKGIAGYDAFYQKLITNFDLVTVTGFFSMETIMEGKAVDLRQRR